MEVWHFEQNSNELFKEYIRDFTRTSLWQKDYKSKEEYAAGIK